MKKSGLVLLASLLTFSMISCGGEKEKDPVGQQNKIVEDISIKTTPKTVYTIGESFVIEGGIIELHYEGGETGELAFTDPSVTVTTPDMTTVGTKTVTVEYDGFVASYQITVKAQTFKVTLDLNYDGAPLTVQQVVKGENINLIIPERPGYEFLGWYYEGVEIVSGIWQYNNDITLMAWWETINYTITYNTDGGVISDYCLKTFTVWDLPYILPVPIKQGYNFVGWYETADFSGEPITEIPKSGLRNYVLYAKYTDEQLLEFELSFDETYYIVIGYKGSPQYITIPKTIDGLLVKEIAVKAFYDCDTLINVTLPDSVTSIGNYAFSCCSGLTSMTIPDSVTSIGDFAFDGCSGLTSITIPDSVTSIGNYAFSYCSGLTSITIPDGVTSIGNYAFYYCSGLTSMTIPDSVTSIGDSAFSDCYGLTSITIPDSVTSIGSSVFFNCYGLTSITIPASVTSIGNSAFPNHLYKRYSGCYYLPTKNSDYGFLCEPIDKVNIINVKIHTDCKIINGSAFDGCRGLTSITIPDGVTSIGDFAFSGCSGLTSMTIPDSVTSIGDSAFSDCSGLTSMTIPDSVTSIGDYVFNGCSELTIYCEVGCDTSGWDSNWNPNNRPVIWGYKNQ